MQKYNKIRNTDNLTDIIKANKLLFSDFFNRIMLLAVLVMYPKIIFFLISSIFGDH